MNSKNYICSGEKFTYNKGYIALPIPVVSLPEIVEIAGVTLQRKSSFHVSLLCVKDILEIQPANEQIILEEFCLFTRENDISFINYTGEFRFAQFEERKTLVALCEVSNLTNFSDFLSKKLTIEIPPQPTHVTLFTLQPDMGIGLNSPADMNSKSSGVEVLPMLKQNLLNLTNASLSPM